jgi:hypothetical protein
MWQDFILHEVPICSVAQVTGTTDNNGTGIETAAIRDRCGDASLAHTSSSSEN